MGQRAFDRDGASVRRRIGAVLACCAALAAGACDNAEGVEVQPLPPLQRPSPEVRAGLPEVRGVWRFAGFEIPPGDTGAVRDGVYTLVPPGDFRVVTQRLDSVAGQYVREGVAFPFTGEVRRDSALTVVAFSEGVGQFAAGRVMRDTLWIELTSFTSAQSWPPGTRAALVRGAVRAPFRRLLGGIPIAPPVDSAALRDSIRLDSLRRAGVIVAPGAQPQTLPGQLPPGAQPAPQRPPAQARPRPQQPRPQQPRPEPQFPPSEPVNEPVTAPSPPPAPDPNAPRDTLRFGRPP
jgi:hypothetical protein